MIREFQADTGSGDDCTNRPAEVATLRQFAPSSAVPPAARRGKTDGTLEMWASDLSALAARLRVIGGDRPVAPRMPRNGGAGHVQAQASPVLLDDLTATLARESRRNRRLEQEIRELRAALTRAHAELAGTRAGERRARHQALHDDLTALPNRTYFREQLAQMLAAPAPQRQPLAVLYIDLDDFKPVNDQHGHDIGDELLRIIGARLTRALRAEDMVSRLGGDEFACLLLGLPGRAQIAAIVRKLFDAVAAPLTIDDCAATVRPSIGIALCPDDGASADALLKSADTAMYRAKREGTGYAFFSCQPAP